MIVTPAEMKAIEESVFAGGVTAEALMDAVGQRHARAHVCVQLVGARARPRSLFYVGKGNNAGDALVAAQSVARAGRLKLGLHVQIRLRLALEGGCRDSVICRARKMV